MTVKLLMDWPDSRNGRNYVAGNLVTTDQGTEDGLVAAKMATTTLTGGTAYAAPDNPPQSAPVVATFDQDDGSIRMSAGAVSDVMDRYCASMGVSLSLGRWRKKLAFDPANAKIALLGDSTSDESTSAASIYNALRNLHTRHGEALEGVVGDSSHILACGYSGMSLAYWLTDTASQALLWAAAPDLVVFSFGINDVRLGQTSQAQLQASMTQALMLIKANLPNCDILLRVPNSLLTTNVGGLNYVQTSGGAINPAGLAQTYSTLLRNAYLSFEGRYSNVEVWDAQAEVFGSSCRATHPLMADQLHPTTQAAAVGGIPLGGGYVALAASLARRIGRKNSLFAVDQSQYRNVRLGYTTTSCGNGYIDLAGQDAQATPAAQIPLSSADWLLIDGFSDPISLGSATIYRPFGGTNIRISLGGTDFTSALGQRIAIVSNHAQETSGDRQIVAVDLPSIAAGAVASLTVPVTGARTGDVHDATAIGASPSAAFHAGGLLLLSTSPSANDTVKIVVMNPTGSAVDLASSNWAFWVIR